MARKPKIQCRIERDTDEAMEQYREEIGDEISQSEAVRHLLRAGLAAKGHPVAAADGGRVQYVENTLLERLASPLTVLGGALLLFISTGFMATAGLFASGSSLTLVFATLAISAVLMLAGTAVIVTATLAQLALARPLRGLVGFAQEAAV